MLPEIRPRGLAPILYLGHRMGGVRAALSTVHMNEPEQAGKKDVAEFLARCPVRCDKRLVLQLPDRTAYRYFTLAEMVDDTKPVLVIDGSEIPVEELRINQERAARDEQLLHPSGQAPGMSHDRRIRVLLHLEPDYWILIKQCRC